MQRTRFLWNKYWSNFMRNGIIVYRLSLIKTYLLAFHVLRKFRDSAPLNMCVCVWLCIIHELKIVQTDQFTNEMYRFEG